MPDMKNHSQWERFGFARGGLWRTWRKEKSFRTEVVVIAAVLASMAWMRTPFVWWLAMGISAALILVAELINTAVENVCDAVHPSQHPGIGAAKDCASAAVLVANLTGLALFIGMVISRWR